MIHVSTFSASSGTVSTEIKASKIFENLVLRIYVSSPLKRDGLCFYCGVEDRSFETPRLHLQVLETFLWANVNIV